MVDAPHRQLAALLRERIADGTYPPGSRFPSVRGIATEHQVGLGTAYRAVELLRQTADLTGEPRKRLEVAHPVAVRTLADPDADWPHQSVPRSVQRVRLSPALAARFGSEARGSVIRETTECLDPDLRPAMLITTWRRGRAHAHVTHHCSVRTHLMTGEEGAALGLISGTLALLVERTRFDAAGSVTEVADLVLPADRWTVGM